MGFLILEHLHTAFHCGYACLSSHQLYPRAPFPPNSRQNVLSLLFLTIATPTSVIFVLLLCISSIINDIEQLFILLSSSVQLLSRVWLFVTPWAAVCQASLSIINSQRLPKLMSIELVKESNHLILCRPLLILLSIFPSIRVFSNKSALRIRWPKYWSFSFYISPSNEHSGLISFKMYWLDLLSVRGTLKSLLQHHSSKASILQCSAL